MPNFGPRWREVEKTAFDGGGQGKIFLVGDTAGTVPGQCAAKVLNGGDLTKDSARWKRLEEEIEVSKSFDHPNVVRVLDSGHTVGSGYPFLVMPFYTAGSLEGYRSSLDSPLGVLTFFAELSDGVAHVHSKNVIHRDLKPKNILIRDGHPVVGDFGLCFRLEAESLTETTEVATPRWYGAPELRDGHLESPPQSADVYSFGKLLYWLFTGQVYDREETQYGIPARKLSKVLAQSGSNNRLVHTGAFVDDIVAETVRYLPDERIKTASELARKVRMTIERVAAGGRALDLSLPQKCLFCGQGFYRPLEPLPTMERRMARPERPTNSTDIDIWANMRSVASNKFGAANTGLGTIGPLILVCDHCGNAQQFRLDLVPDIHKNWRP